MNTKNAKAAAALAAALCATVLRADFREEMALHPVGIRDGLTLKTAELRSPRRIKAYIARIDLSTPGVKFISTGRDPRWGSKAPDAPKPFTIDTRRETTADFMARRRAEGDNVEIAANADPWVPFPSPSAYASLNGWNVSEGVEVSHSKNLSLPMFAIRRDGTPEIRQGIPAAETNDVLFAFRGFALVMSGGKPVGGDERPKTGKPEPRMVYGLTPDRKTLVLVAIDGRQPGYSEGASYSDICTLLKGEGVSDAINMDGGGSTSLVLWDRKTARPLMLNRHPGRTERRVATNLGIVFPRESSKRDLERLGANLHGYEFPEDSAETPPPEGWEPFYASHLGRHGSRRIIADRPARAFRAIDEAKKAGLLNEKGLELHRILSLVAADWSDGMSGELTERGAEEHREIARRFAARMGKAFSERRRVRVQSTTYPRVIASMANFIVSLLAKAPLLEPDFGIARRWEKTLVTDPPRPSAAERKRLEAAKAPIRKREIRPERFFARLFTDPEAARRIVKSRTEFMRDVYECAADCQDLRTEIGGEDLFAFFERDELEACSRYWEASLYCAMGNSEEAGKRIVTATRRLARDIVKRADEAIADDRIAADLRFGHDTGVWSLAGLIGIEGAGDRVPMADVWKRAPVWKYVSVASNVQFVFYRRKPGEADPLVKIIYNERETRLRDLEPSNGPFYRWKALRAHLLGCAANPK